MFIRKFIRYGLLFLLSFLFVLGLANASTCGSNMPYTKPNSQYTVSTDGTEVTDTKTGLIWQRCALGMTWNGSTCAGTATLYKWEDGLAQAASVASTTGVSWRLPNQKELVSLIEWNCYGQSINQEMFPVTPNVFLSSSQSMNHGYVVWFVNFSDDKFVFPMKDASLAVRLVRSQ